VPISRTAIGLAGSVGLVRKRKRIGLRASLKTAVDQPGSTVSGDGGYAAVLVGIWYWIAGVSARDDEADQ
jgi:hypothetical protein